MRTLRNSLLGTQGSLKRAIVVALSALLILPPASWVMAPGSAGPFQAHAQIVVVSCDPTPKRIIQDICDAGPDMSQFEKDGVNEWLTLHQMPASAASDIYQYGRSDLRTEIRTHLFADLTAIINKDPSQRTTHEKAIYTWFQRRIQKAEIALYRHAVGDATSWENDPCNWKPDPDIASAYGVNYNGAPFCHPNPLQTFFGVEPQWPGFDYFYAAAEKSSYEAPVTSVANGGNILVASQLNTPLAMGLSALGGAALGAAGAGLIYSLVGQIFPFSLGYYAPEFYEGAYAIAANITDFSVGAAVGPGIIIAIAAYIGVEGGLQAFQYESALNQIGQLQNLLTAAQNTAPDLANFLKTSDGAFKANMAFVNATLPDFPSSQALPSHHDGVDFVPVVTGVGQSSPQAVEFFTSQDFDGVNWQVSTWGPWFVQRSVATASTPAVDSITPTLHVIDAIGAKLLVSRVGRNFLIAKAESASGDQVCPADPLTGVSQAADLAKCSSYVAGSFPIKNGAPLGATVALYGPPAFTSSSTAFVTNGVSSNFPITATGSPAPAISLSSGSLPAGFSLVHTGSGAELDFNGAGTNGSYPVTLQASNAGGTVTQKLNIIVGTQLQITSPNTLNATAGIPVSFQVTTTGYPPPTLTLGVSLPSGLSFKDNGDGTATISGTTFQRGIEGCISPSGGPCGMTATNAGGTVVQNFSIAVASAPLAPVVPAAATFTAGVPNQWNISTVGALTPVSLGIATDSAPWLSYTDNGNGIRTISGVPPAGTAGTFDLFFHTSQPGASIGIGTLTLTVVDPPLFVMPGSFTFTAGAAKSFAITTNQASGAISVSGDLPAGVQLVNTTPGQAMIIGTAKRAGTFPLALTWQDGSNSVSSTLVFTVLPSLLSSSGAPLVNGQSLASPNGYFQAIVQNDGNFVIYAQDKAIWSTGTNKNPSASQLVMQQDGNLVLYVPAARCAAGALCAPAWASGSYGKGTPPYTLAMQDDGNLVIYDANHTATWASNTINTVSPISVGDTLSSGAALETDQALASQNGIYQAVVQADGNFVVFHGRKAIWATATNGKGTLPFRLAMQSDGNLVLYGSGTQCAANEPCAATWASKTYERGTAPYTLTMQDDGNLVIYDSTKKAIWSTRTNGS
ncbi:MAG TPA: hypothetical protein VH640_20225 [Bryobacteraceae bacterium]|jgi:hypothetical protein